MNNKKLLSIPELVEHMKSKGILFNIISEKAAMHFLEEHNYYYKLSAYRKNYDKRLNGPNADTYMRLEFAYLQDLSTIDCKLRYLILSMCLDIEHSLKIILLNDIANNPKEDGYNIINLWDASNNHRSKIKSHLKTSYCKEIINKFHPDYPAFSLCELISFGELCNLVSFYDQLYPSRLPFNTKLLYPVRDIRNASAHSNCLINDVRSSFESKPNHDVLKFVQSIKSISKRVRNAKLRNKPIHDFICLMYFYPLIVKSEYLRANRKEDLSNLIKLRITKHKEYYRQNATLQTTYIFIRRILKNILKAY